MPPASSEAGGTVVIRATVGRHEDGARRIAEHPMFRHRALKNAAVRVRSILDHYRAKFPGGSKDLAHLGCHQPAHVDKRERRRTDAFESGGDPLLRLRKSRGVDVDELDSTASLNRCNMHREVVT